MTLVIAHRGASRSAPENTIEAFVTAREMGADWIELDVRRTSDGVVVVHHDACLEDGEAIAEISSAELPGDVPSLAEALEACDGMGVNIEVKNLPDDPDYDEHHLVTDAVAGLVAAYLTPDRVIVSSFNIDAVERLRQVDPSIPIGWVTFDLGDPAQAVARAVAHELASIHPYEAVVDEALVRRAHDVGLAVHVWTVDETDRMEQLLDLGVDGIITNVPDIAREIVDRHHAAG